MITVILNGYKRPHTLREQYDAIKKQTVDDVTIMLWANSVGDHHDEYPAEVVESCESTMSNGNYGVWGRFAHALNAKTKYVCIIDDDTIPGSKWLENCLVTMETHRGPLSTRGAIMNQGKDMLYPRPDSYTPVGWCNPNETPTRVDMLCHSWFLEKNWLRAFWAEMPDDIPMNFGEDMHVSYSIKKHFGLNSYVPPHPKDDLEMWGSMPETAIEYGEDAAAISWNNEANMGMGRYWNFIRKNGYKIIADEQQ